MDKNNELEEALVFLDRLQRNEVKCTRELLRQVEKFISDNGSEISENFSPKLRVFFERIFNKVFTELSRKLGPVANHKLEQGDHTLNIVVNGHGTG